MQWILNDLDMKKLFFLLIMAVVVASCDNAAKKSDAGSAAEQTVAAKPTKKVIVARLTVKEGAEAAFIEVASALVKATNQESGCLFYNLYQSPVDPKSFLFYEEYVDQAAFDFHAASDHFKAFQAGIDGLVDGDMIVGQF